MEEKKPAVFRSVLNPKTPVLVSCRGKDGRDNALAVVHADASLVGDDGKIDWSRIEFLKV
jgi:hypothetical protein